MKKLFSIIILILCSAASVAAIVFVSTLIFTLIQMIYASSRALFWIVIFLGGSFGLGLFWYIIPIAANLTIRASQKISLSKSGLRYTVMGILIIALYGLNLLGLIINKTAVNLASSILSYVLLVLYAIVLIMHGRETAVSEYVPSTDPTPQYNKQPTQATTQEKKSNKDIPIESLRSLKALHDEGILTEHEFSEKKKQLLNLNHQEPNQAASDIIPDTGISTSNKYAVGEAVNHKLFGHGVIVSILESDNEITIDFNGNLKKFTLDRIDEFLL